MIRILCLKPVKNTTVKEINMDKQVITPAELNEDQQDMLRSLLDCEMVLIGGGEAIGFFN